MATLAQISANRGNSKLSTGPTSPEGKSRSSLNAVKLGTFSRALLLPTEDETEFNKLAEEEYESWNPVGPREHMKFEEIVGFKWRIRRHERVQTGLWSTELPSEKKPSFPTAVYVDPIKVALLALTRN